MYSRKEFPLQFLWLVGIAASHVNTLFLSVSLRRQYRSNDLAAFLKNKVTIVSSIMNDATKTCLLSNKFTQMIHSGKLT